MLFCVSLPPASKILCSLGNKSRGYQSPLPSASPYLLVTILPISWHQLNSYCPLKALLFCRPLDYSSLHTPVSTGRKMAQHSPSFLLPLLSHCITSWCKNTLSFGHRSILLSVQLSHLSPCFHPCLTQQQPVSFLKIYKLGHVILCLKPSNGPQYTQSKF